MNERQRKKRTHEARGLIIHAQIPYDIENEIAVHGKLFNPSDFESDPLCRAHLDYFLVLIVMIV